MTIQIANASLLFSLFTAIFGAAAALISVLRNSTRWFDSSRRAVLLTFLYQSAATGILLSYLISKDYHIDYVYQTVDNAMSLWMRIAALWGKQSGSLLFWSWLLSLFTFILSRTVRDRRELGIATVFLMSNLTFFIYVNFSAENPFPRLWTDINTGNVYKSIAPLMGMMAYTPENGLGMNPLLRHFGMILHPPALYLGYIGVFIPASLQIAAAFQKNSENEWLKNTRGWYLFSWIFLAIGLLLGSRWAYDVLGWGGYWGWDPVEVSALIPFLLLTAYVHAVIGNRITGRFRSLAAILGLAAAFSVVFSTFVTRSGLIQSIHAFSVSPMSASLTGYTVCFLLFIIFVIVRSISANVQSKAVELIPFGTFLQTRTFLFYGLITLFAVISFFCLWGILLPTVMNLISGTSMVVDESFYTQSTGPLFLLLIIALGIYPLTSWKHGFSKRHLLAIILAASLAIVPVLLTEKSQPFTIWRSLAVWSIGFSLILFVIDKVIHAFEDERGKRKFRPARLFTQYFHPCSRLSEALLHLGVLLIALGIIGIEFFQQEGQLSLAVGETKTYQGYQITLAQYDVQPTSDGMLTESILNVIGPKGKRFSVYPYRKYYDVYNQETTIPGIRSTLQNDFYAILMSSSVAGSNDAHLFTFFLNPLINFLWIGGWVLCIGGFLALIMPSLIRKRANG